MRKTNPKGADNEILRCHCYGSFRHLLPECPDSWENITEHDGETNEHVVCFTDGDTGSVTILGRESRNCAVLDSACSSIESLTEEDRKTIKTDRGIKPFKFGGGRVLQSKRSLQFWQVMTLPSELMLLSEIFLCCCPNLP